MFVGGHSVSFTAAAILEHAEGAIDCVLKGEGEASVADLLLAAEPTGGALRCPRGRDARIEGPPAGFVDSSTTLLPARDLLRHRRKYFIGMLDPCASIEFSRGCPWDCSFCSAWTFYGRSYRTSAPNGRSRNWLASGSPASSSSMTWRSSRPEHGLAIGEAIAREGIRKKILPGNAR